MGLPQVSAAIKARKLYLENEKAESLKSICRQLRINVGGTKSDLVDRILAREDVLRNGGRAGPTPPPPGQ